jgi:hypothetical protein
LNLQMYVAVSVTVASTLVACLIGHVRSSKRRQRSLQIALMRETEMRLFRFLP